MESPPPVRSTAVSIELSVLPFNEGYNAFNPSAKTFSRCQFYTFEVGSYLNTVPAVLKKTHFRSVRRIKRFKANLAENVTFAQL